MSTTLQNIPVMLAVAVLVERLGGEVIITQSDIDHIAYTRLLEGWVGEHVILKVEHKTGALPS